MTTQDFQDIARRLRPLLMRIATDFFNNREEAEDAVQEVLVKMWLRPWKPDDNIEALSVKDIKNQCISTQMKLALRRTTDIDKAGNTAGAEESDTRIRVSEQEETIERAIRGLPKWEQRLIRMKQQGLETEEIATVTGIAIPSVRSILSSARKKLIKQLKP